MTPHRCGVGIGVAVHDPASGVPALLLAVVVVAVIAVVIIIVDQVGSALDDIGLAAGFGLGGRRRLGTGRLVRGHARARHHGIGRVRRAGHAHVRDARGRRVGARPRAVALVDDHRGHKHGRGRARNAAVEAGQALEHGRYLTTDGLGRRNGGSGSAGSRRDLTGRPVVTADTGRVGDARTTKLVGVVMGLVIAAVHQEHVVGRIRMGVKVVGAVFGGLRVVPVVDERGRKADAVARCVKAVHDRRRCGGKRRRSRHLRVCRHCCLRAIVRCCGDGRRLLLGFLLVV